jgi:hypothetical protein
MEDNLRILIECLRNNNISIIAVGVGTYQKLCFDYFAVIQTQTIDFKRSAAAHFCGTEIFLNIGIVGREFKFGIKKDNKISWSIPIKLTTTPQELAKIIKLKNYW